MASFIDKSKEFARNRVLPAAQTGLRVANAFSPLSVAGSIVSNPGQFLKTSYRTVSAPMNTFGKAVGFAATAPFESRRLAQEAQTNQNMARLLQRKGDFNKAQSYLDRSTKETRSFADQSKKQSLNAVAGAVGTGLTVLGAKGLNSVSGAIGALTVPTVLGGGMARLQGQDVATGAGQGFGSSLKLQGLNQLTNPLIGKLAPGINKMSLLPRTLVKGGVNALSNVAEDALQTAVDEQRRMTKNEVLFSAGLGFGTGAAGELIPAGGKVGKKIVKEAKQTRDESFLNQALDLERSIIKAGNSQQRVSGGRYGKKTKLGVAIGSGNAISQEIPLVRLVTSDNHELRVSPSELYLKPELLQYYKGPANASAQRLFKSVGQGGFVSTDLKSGDIKFQEPYQRGDITKIQSRLNEVSGKDPITTKRMLEEFAQKGDPEAVTALKQIEQAENELANAQIARESNTSKVTNPLDSQNPLIQSSLDNSSQKGRLETQRNIQPTSQLLQNGQERVFEAPTSKKGQRVQSQESIKLQRQPNPSEGIVPRDTTQASNLNVARLNLQPDQQSRVLQSQVKELREVLSDKEVTRIAQGAGIDTNTHTIEQTAEKIAGQLNVRRQVVELENQRTQMLKSGDVEGLERITAEIAEKSRISREQGTEIARQLSARRIIANEINTPMQRVFQLMDKAGVNPEVYIKEGAKVDFNDGKQVIDFYRKFVPPKPGEWLDLVRYNSMLSSPNTFINNAFSNLQGSLFVAPIEKTITGGLDALKSAITGSERQYRVGEGGAYAKGYLKSVGKARQAFVDAMRGKTFTGNIDSRQIPLTTEGSQLRRVESKLQFPMKLLEATDQFFTTLTKGGVESSLNYREAGGIRVKNKDLLMDAEAAKRLFRSDLGDNQGSKALDALDFFANKIQEAKGNDNIIVRTIAKYTLPFVQTPTNVLKQGLEYSLLGLSTLPGSKVKTEQLSKVVMGSSVAMGVATLLGTDRLTWAEPTSEKQKQAFKASGMQPYSVKIGDKWVSYSKMHPAIAFNLALVSSIKNAEDNKDLDESQIQTLLKGTAKWVNFFADQSYVKSIGDLVATTKGDIQGPSRQLGNYAQQLVPFRALMGWVARLTDPYQRQADPDGTILEKQMQYLMTQIPGLSMKAPTRKDQFGNPLSSQHPLINAFSPARISTENPVAKKEFEFLQEKSKFEKEKRQTKEKLEREMLKDDASVTQVGASGEMVKGKGLTEDYKNQGVSNSSEPTQGTSITKLDDLKKEKVKTYLDYGRAVSEEDLTNYYLGDLASMPSDNVFRKAIKEKEAYSTLGKIISDEKLSPEQKNVLYKRLGVTKQDADYFEIAREDNNIKGEVVLDEITRIAKTSKDRGQMLEYLASGRREIGGNKIVSDGVVDQLYKMNLIDKSERKYLKDLDFDGVTKSFKLKTTGRGKKARIKKITPVAVKKYKVSQKSGRELVNRVKSPVFSSGTTRNITLKKGIRLKLPKA